MERPVLLVVGIPQLLLLLLLLLFIWISPWTSVVVHGLSLTSTRRQVLYSSPGLILVAAFLDDREKETNDNSTGDDSMLQPASSVRRPYAPIETLVPAIRVALQIEQSLDLIATMNNKSLSYDKKNDAMLSQQLRTIWIDQPVDYFGGGLENRVSQKEKMKQHNSKAVPAQTFLDRYEQNRNRISWTQQPSAWLVERGEIDAWQNLRLREQQQSQSQPARAAFNYYTDALQFDSRSYLLKVSKEERSRMIRNDQLPNINQVVVSDLDLRYLYRNQVLTNIDDVMAELSKMLPDDNDDDDSNNTIDIDEVTKLLDGANIAMQQWLDCIDPNDVQSARALALQ